MQSLIQDKRIFNILKIDKHLEHKSMVIDDDHNKYKDRTNWSAEVFTI